MRIIFLLVCFFCTTRMSVVLAADYSVSPLLIEQDIAPRDIFEETIKISNTTNRPLRLYPTVNAITLGEEGEILTFVPASMGNTATSVTSWIAITRANQELAPGETIKVPMTVSVSPNALPGDYHAFIGFADADNRDQAEAIVAKGLAPGVVVRFSLKEKRNEYLRLERFMVPRFVVSGRNAQVTYDIVNEGSVPLVPTGEIIFYDGSGNEQKAIPVNDKQIAIQPQATESFSIAVPELGLIGRHKAFLNIEYGSKERANVYDTVYFNIIPLNLLMGIFIIILVLSVVITLHIHRRKLGHQQTDTEETVVVYVRSGTTGDEKDHDINLKK